jgi:hypothetical protein
VVFADPQPEERPGCLLNRSQRPWARQLVRYIELLHAQRPGLTTTVILTELVVERRRHRLLHSSVAPKLRRALRGRPGIVITAIPFRVGD